MPCSTDLWGRSPELDEIPEPDRMGEDPRAIRQLTEIGSRMRPYLCIRVLSRRHTGRPHTDRRSHAACRSIDNSFCVVLPRNLVETCATRRE
jgi:hypothetical protein